MPLDRTLLTFLLMCGACSAQALELEGHSIAPAMQMAGRTLVLNGAAVRRFAIFKVEVAALYLEQRQSTLEGVASGPGAKRLRLVMLRTVSAEDMHRKFMGDLESVSTQSELAQVKSEIGLLDQMFRHVSLRPGDVITLDWLPGSGIVASHNGRALAENPIPAELLYRMVLRIFLGPDASRNAREKLLGLQPIDN